MKITILVDHTVNIQNEVEVEVPEAVFFAHQNWVTGGMEGKSPMKEAAMGALTEEQETSLRKTSDEAEWCSASWFLFHGSMDDALDEWEEG